MGGSCCSPPPLRVGAEKAPETVVSGMKEGAGAGRGHGSAGPGGRRCRGRGVPWRARGGSRSLLSPPLLPPLPGRPLSPPPAPQLGRGAESRVWRTGRQRRIGGRWGGSYASYTVGIVRRRRGRKRRRRRRRREGVPAPAPLRRAEEGGRTTMPVWRALPARPHGDCRP